DHFRPRPALGALARDLPARFLAGRLPGDRFLPADLPGRLLYVWVFLMFWIVALAALTGFFLRTRAHRDPDAPGRARAILTRGGSSLSYMSTWPGNQYWFSPDGRAAVAYRAIGAVAVTVGGPYGDPAAHDSAITEFAAFCEHRGLQPCLYSITAQAPAVTHRRGGASGQTAEAPGLRRDRRKFPAKRGQAGRPARNKAAKEGTPAQWHPWPRAPPDLAAQIRRISAAWMAGKGLPEMGFTL